MYINSMYGGEQVVKAVGFVVDDWSMRTQRVKRSEPFWPSIVMKKWLNIKPKVNDFSEDEVDTESEDDGSSPKYATRHEDNVRVPQGFQSVCSTEATGRMPSKEHSLKHRRGKSETLRVLYINTKDVRVTIGTWNVSGRLPNDNLDIDEWLCIQEPADMYILGFQEVVPLNAGNVLGAENRRPISKWEAIIRKTLNKSSEPETKHKSYSAPPSPVLRTSSASDVLADVPVLEIIGENSTCVVKTSDSEKNSVGKNIHISKIYGIDWDSRLDWPEHSLEATSQTLASRDKLRRVLSSSARIGSGWMDSSLAFGPQSSGQRGSVLNKMHHSSGNLGLICMDQDDKLDILDSLSDESEQIFGDEEDPLVEMLEVKQENAPSKDALKSRPMYIRIVSKQMVGIYISVWVHRRLRRGRSDAGTSAYARLGVSRIYKLIRTNRVSRNRFMSSVVRKFEMPRWNNYVIPFLMYCTEILALLPFTAPDEPLYLIYIINRLVQVRAGILESNMKDFLHSVEGIYPKGNGNGIVQSDQTIQYVSERSMYVDGNHKVSEEFPGHHLSGDPQSKNSDNMEDSYCIPKIDLQKIQADCLASGAIQLLLKLKRHLKIVFGLDDARCQAYSPNEPPKPGESLLRQNISFNISDVNIDPPNTSEDFLRRYQDFKNALKEDTVDYSTYTANIKKKRPPPRRGGKASRMADAEDDDDYEDENWTNGVNRINRSGRKGGVRTRQRCY